ncbi:uncharacterized protein FIESC28_01054 [Fusarium coffeatum]|uniref:LysM domain-containing protein n=1 Tax=Fusarium coffeatum TaxID=231269 RepID=A0A366SA08_9HYPO|nr:uncharacterized protein FIESC28_01054 [Fusarium coffeatum]RBR26163.1 hypothetical protein FIESC28_01054 [Fusarium coffeatum]
MVVIQRLVPLLSLYLGSSAAFSLYYAEDLERKNVGDACVKAMSADIDCPVYIRSFKQGGYYASLGNVTLTDEIFASACANEKKVDDVPQFYGGYIWAGWNETCDKDPKTNRYCNEDTEDLEHEEKLCLDCNRRKLEMMQSSSYSEYDSFYRSKLVEVYEKCGGSGPTDIPLTPWEEGRERFCPTKKYHTTKGNETCDSIAKAHPGVAGYDLYVHNKRFIADCRKIRAGIKLCLPPICPIHVVQPGDTCESIEQENDLETGRVRGGNWWIKSDCSDLQEATDLYGKPICIGYYPQETYGPRIKFSSANGPPIPQLRMDDDDDDE